MNQSKRQLAVKTSVGDKYNLTIKGNGLFSVSFIKDERYEDIKSLGYSLLQHSFLRAFYLLVGLLLPVEDVVAQGVTIITHGFTIGAKGEWVEKLAEAIQVRIGGSVHRYEPDTGRWHLHSLDLDRPEEIILIFNWTAESDANPFLFGPNWRYAEAAGDALYAALRNASGLPVSGEELLGRQLHFIGHSRGCSVLSETIRRLGTDGVMVDQFTAIDPHPVNGTHDEDERLFGLLGRLGWGDTIPRRWRNVSWGDNYHRADVTMFVCDEFADFDGDQLPGFHSVDLTKRLGDTEGVIDTDSCGFFCFDEHIRIHAWYHGTVDTETEEDGAGCGIGPDGVWYPEGRHNIGYAFSNVEAGVGRRPALRGEGEDPGMFDVIFNGGFDRQSQAGWTFHGGGGDGLIDDVDGRDVLRLTDVGNSRTHNRILLPGTCETLQYEVKILNSSDNDALLVKIGSDIIQRVGLATRSADFESKRVAIPARHRGTVNTVTLEIEGGGLFGVDSDVLIDDVRILDETAPQVTGVEPTSEIRSENIDVFVAFSEPVRRYGNGSIDKSDLVLSGPASVGTNVGDPEPAGTNRWRFPISDLSRNGTLRLTLAPDPRDIEDLFDNPLQTVSWDVAVQVTDEPSPGQCPGGCEVSLLNCGWAGSGIDGCVHTADRRDHFSPAHDFGLFTVLEARDFGRRVRPRVEIRDPRGERRFSFSDFLDSDDAILCERATWWFRWENIPILSPAGRWEARWEMTGDGSNWSVVGSKVFYYRYVVEAFIVSDQGFGESCSKPGTRNIFGPDSAEVFATAFMSNVSENYAFDIQFFGPPERGIPVSVGFSTLHDLSPDIFPSPESDSWMEGWRWNPCQSKVLRFAGAGIARQCGDWEARLLVRDPNGTEIIEGTQRFRIEEREPPIVLVSREPEVVKAGDPVTIGVSASDNNDLDVVTLYWNDGAEHSNQWNAINSGSISRNHGIGSFAEGARVTYWAVVVDESGNRVTSDHGEFVVSASEAPFRRGDINQDGRITIGDGLTILLCQFRGREELCSSCRDAADVNNSGEVGIEDAIQVFRYIFREGEEPASPYPECGDDPVVPDTDDDRCESFDGC